MMVDFKSVGSASLMGAAPFHARDAVPCPCQEGHDPHLGFPALHAKNRASALLSGHGFSIGSGAVRRYFSMKVSQAVSFSLVQQEDEVQGLT